MAVRIGDEAPDFSAQTTEGTIRFHEWIGDSWAVLFSHPKDFTPVCTTELGYLTGLKPEVDKRRTKIIGRELGAFVGAGVLRRMGAGRGVRYVFTARDPCQ